MKRESREKKEPQWKIRRRKHRLYEFIKFSVHGCSNRTLKIMIAARAENKKAEKLWDKKRKIEEESEPESDGELQPDLERWSLQLKMDEYQGSFEDKLRAVQEPETEIEITREEL